MEGRTAQREGMIDKLVNSPTFPKDRNGLKSISSDYYLVPLGGS